MLNSEGGGFELEWLKWVLPARRNASINELIVVHYSLFCAQWSETTIRMDKSSVHKTYQAAAMISSQDQRKLLSWKASFKSLEKQHMESILSELNWSFNFQELILN